MGFDGGFGVVRLHGFLSVSPVAYTHTIENKQTPFWRFG